MLTMILNEFFCMVLFYCFIRQLQNGGKQYYVHFLEYNKRLDEWVSEDRLNFSNVEPPKPKDNETKNNMNTPKRSASASAAPSRPSTPPGKT